MKKGIFFFLFLIATLFFINRVYLPGFERIRSAKKELLSLRKENERLKKENESIRREIEALKNDLFMIEEIARKELGLAKPGEVVYKFDEGHIHGDT